MVLPDPSRQSERGLKYISLDLGLIAHLKIEAAQRLQPVSPIRTVKSFYFPFKKQNNNYKHLVLDHTVYIISTKCYNNYKIVAGKLDSEQLKLLSKFSIILVSPKP